MKTKKIETLLHHIIYTPIGIIVSNENPSVIRIMLEYLKTQYKNLLVIESLKNRVNDVMNTMEHLPIYLADYHTSMPKENDPDDKCYQMIVALKNGDLSSVRVNKDDCNLSSFANISKNGDYFNKQLCLAIKLYLQVTKPLYISTPLANVDINSLSNDVYDEEYLYTFGEKYPKFKWIVETYSFTNVAVIELAMKDDVVNALVNVINNIWEQLLIDNVLNLHQEGVSDLIDVYLLGLNPSSIISDSFWNNRTN